MGEGLSMATRHEITKRYARKYAAAAKKERGRILDELVRVSGWSRANAPAGDRRGEQTSRPGTGGGAQASARIHGCAFFGCDLAFLMWCSGWGRGRASARSGGRALTCVFVV
jgi:hypothetical protein